MRPVQNFFVDVYDTKGIGAVLALKHPKIEHPLGYFKTFSIPFSSSEIIDSRSSFERVAMLEAALIDTLQASNFSISESSLCLITLDHLAYFAFLTFNTNFAMPPLK